MASETKLFMAAVDIFHPDFDLDALKNLLKKSSSITGWWNHIPGCFLLTTDRTPDQIVDELRQVTGRARLLVVAADPSQSEGWLPPRSWDWIRRREPEHTTGHTT